MAVADHLLPVFSFRPNWRDGIGEALDWLTDILSAARTGAEQRIALRLTPRRSFEARLDLLDAERTFADLFIRRFHGEEFMLPLWHDHATLTSAVSLGASTLPVDTVDREFVDDGMALLVGPDALSCEAVRIATVGTSSLTLLTPVTNAWRTGTVIHPLRRSRFDKNVSAEHITDRLDRLKLRFDLSQANDYDGGVEELATYSGLPILSPAPNWSGTIDMEHIRALFEVDNKIGLKHVGDPAARGFSSQRHRWMLEGRASLAAFYRLLYRLCGRQGSVLVPTFTSDLTLASAATAGATSIDVVKCGLDYADFPAAGRQFGITPGGEVLHFSALAASPGVGVERLNLSAPLASDLAFGVKLSWLDIGRLDSDRIELIHETDSDGVTTVEAPFRTFSDTRDGSAAGALDLPTAAMDDDPCNPPSDIPGGGTIIGRYLAAEHGRHGPTGTHDILRRYTSTDVPELALVHPSLSVWAGNTYLHGDGSPEDSLHGLDGAGTFTGSYNAGAGGWWAGTNPTSIVGTFSDPPIGSEGPALDDGNVTYFPGTTIVSSNTENRCVWWSTSNFTERSGPISDPPPDGDATYTFVWADFTVYYMPVYGA